MTCPAVMLCLISLAAPDGSPPVARWGFSAEEAKAYEEHGNVQGQQAGPRPPEFPDFDKNNLAVRLSGKGTFLSLPDSGPASKFDFANGDAITIEAWVNPTRIRDGQLQYIVGKGRTGSPEFARDNQNWALRIVGAKGGVHLSFLFATKPTKGDKHWHRWTSEAGVPVGSGWHHLAVSYRFGDPKSIRGWINGESTDGRWDMGGTTREAPVVDDDEVRIGSNFEGLLDEIAIYRAVLTDKVVASRFRRVGKRRITKPQVELMPQLASVPEGQVLVHLGESMPAYDRWLYEGEAWPEPSVSWHSDLFLLPRIPQKYDSWGIRGSWKAPLLLRMASDVDLPTGRNRFLLRARGLGRLWVDGKVVARTEARTQRPPDGEEPVTPVPEPPLPGFRIPGYRQQEVRGDVEITGAGDSRRCRVILELVVGGKDRRTETGEVCVSLLSQDAKAIHVLGAGGARLTLTDRAVEPVLQQSEQSLARFDDSRRRAAAASQDAFWDRRHQRARNWITKNIPAAKGGDPIESFLDAKIERAVAAASGENARRAEHFHGQVLPIFREHCFRCHGEKEKGGLKLNSRSAALRGGESGSPAIVAGDPSGSELIARIRSTDEDLRMPPSVDGLEEKQIRILEEWIRGGADWPSPPLKQSDVSRAPVIGDEGFLRRVYLDIVGVPPTESEAWSFTKDDSPNKRQLLIDRLVRDERFADHWMSFWLDLLAENPSLLNASLNSTGPFRWFLYESLRDAKPLDRMVTELLMLRGGAAEGGSAGFGLAGENDAPLAAKGHILASAFLGIELQCARCHDSPYHSTTQRDLYSLAAMLGRKPVKVPATSRVPAAFFQRQKSRESLIRATLKPNEAVSPNWPFETVTGVSDGPQIDRLMRDPADSRERLATLITAPNNARFPRVLANRIWDRLMGAGLVEPVEDWEGNTASHPELLDWLARELVASGYDLRHLVRRIVSSKAYQRAATGQNRGVASQMRFFNAPDRRRLTAEQIVDSLHVATGKSMDVEELTFVHDGRRPLGQRQTLGRPTRAWMFGDLKNERDRPSLSLPGARAVVDVLEAFGWTGARQMPISRRDCEPSVLQPGVLANGVLTANLTRASDQSELAVLAIQATSPESLVERLFLRVLARMPKPEESQLFVAELKEGFELRLIPPSEVVAIEGRPRLPQVTWFNHLRPKASEIQLEAERRVQAGPQPDPRLRPKWREVYEDVVWSLINHREFVWMP